MSIRIVWIVIPLVGSTFFLAEAHAQTRGAGGSTLTGSSLAPSTNMSSTSLSPSSFSSGTGTSGSGLTGQGGLTGQAGAVNSPVRQNFLTPSAAITKGFLIPSNASPTTGATATTGGFTGGTRLGSFPSGLGGLGGLGGLNQMGGANRNATTTGTTPLRVPLRVVPNPTVIATSRASVATRFNDRLANLPRFQNQTAVTMQIEGRTGVLTGRVASMEQGDLIARLALLEPGIASVRNELVVDPSLVPPEPLPAAETVTPQ